MVIRLKRLTAPQTNYRSILRVSDIRERVCVGADDILSAIFHHLGRKNRCTDKLFSAVDGSTFDLKTEETGSIPHQATRSHLNVSSSSRWAFTGGWGLRLTNNATMCLTTDFDDNARPFPLEYVSTNLSSKGAGMDSSSKRLDKNTVRTVVSPRAMKKSVESEDPLPTAYVITPTYARLTQKADLLRLCYTLMHVPRAHWIVVEDSAEKTATVTEILANCRGPSITHLAVTGGRTQHRGVAQRNAALDWVHRCVRPSSRAGGLYFADDDNTYDLLVFEAVRWTEKITVWPVGIVGGAVWEGPRCLNDKVVGWDGQVLLGRKFPLDMAAFSIGMEFLLLHPHVRFRTTWKTGFLETMFLESFDVPVDQLSVQPDPNCTQVLAWHTQTKLSHQKIPRKH